MILFIFRVAVDALVIKWGEAVYDIDGSKFRRIEYSGVWEIEVDISQLRDFTALDMTDAIIISHNYGIDLNTCKSVIKQSNTTFKLADEGVRVPIIIPINAYKLGRILAKNSDYIQLVGDVPTPASDEITNGILFELEQETGESTLLASHHFKFKLTIPCKTETTMSIYRN